MCHAIRPTVGPAKSSVNSNQNEECHMKHNQRKLAVGLAVLAAGSLAWGTAWAAEKSSGHPGTPQPELEYKGAPVPIKPEETTSARTPQAPPPHGAEISPR